MIRYVKDYPGNPDFLLTSQQVCEAFSLTEEELGVLMFHWCLPYWVDDVDSPPKFCPTEWATFMQRMHERIERGEPMDSITLADEAAAAMN